MKITNITFLILIISLSGCSSWNKTQKGALIGTTGGAATGAVIGRASGNTSLGAIIGATVGGVSGALIGRTMDKQAEDLRKNIPNANVERVGEGIVIEFNNKILFGFDQSNLTSDARLNLNNLVEVLQKYPDTNIEIQGHTDDQGTNKYNKSLSKRRAKSVYQYIAQTNIKSNRLSTKGFGETSPKYSNSNIDGQAQNRRVEFLVSANSKMKKDAENNSNQVGNQ
ncbi:MAG: OmpA family protein [Saprospiraceae bacterium]|jgi:outer membrane protein OmpA-like peptidoglycan-associated protein|nr:OmpA family protein [Candidatus Defluviibacterium haderslevense]MBL0237123.1 OmpA family protein [Candidatus Defluviibacterium haderslevense]MCI1267820.1 OmpA family protein [Saprospiraceae bacterium]